MKKAIIVFVTFCIIGCNEKLSESTPKINASTLKIDSAMQINSLSLKRITEFKTYMSSEYKEIEFQNQIFNNSLIAKFESIADTIINFQFTSKNPITNTYGQQSFQRPRISIVKFSSKEATTKATALLLDCFPNDCQKITFKAAIGKKITPSIYLLNDTEILALEIDCENENLKWEDLKSEFMKLKSKNTTIILAKCGAIEWAL